MQVRQNAVHFSESVQVLLLSLQQDWPDLEPPLQVHAPFMQELLVVHVWLPLPPPVPVPSEVPQAKKRELTARNIPARRAVMGRFVPHGKENAAKP